MLVWQLGWLLAADRTGPVSPAIFTPSLDGTPNVVYMYMYTIMNNYRHHN